MSSNAAFDSKKPTTKQELITANIKLLIEQLEAGHSDALTNYLTAMSRFHNYSFGNVLEIARQMPTATRVAGFWTWKNLGRSVNSGAKGIRILAPIVGIRRKKDREAEKDITKQNERVLVGFRNAYVFDISQTNGVDLPTIERTSGDPGEGIERLAAFLNTQGVQLVYNPKIAPALGMSYGGRIAILPGQSKAEEFSTLVHETAHEMLHKAERRTATTKTVRETEAEAVAFVVGKAVVHPYEEAQGFQRLLDMPGYDVATLVEKSGKSAAHVYARLSLLQLIPPVAEAFSAELITASHANVPRNAGTMPGRVHLDTSFSRAFLLNPKNVDHLRTATFTARSTNLLNHTNVIAVGTVVSSSNFSQPVTAETARRLELGVRFSF